ncbi:hypothetical protein Afil01_08380 [Actinorhabdospora filicis]|uniref:Peptidase S1 domain-containing protein n=1 Tax=Actinorhabdospora filicis TaxID=1785913 RepID=A0A9W6SK02_9ACTN|nr:trypsin-like serine protease [Actinorhabdospora filicis]GLZ76031.1 hypothetical protein Afil01_08380 [Actinorhabdospora filicis]
MSKVIARPVLLLVLTVITSFALLLQSAPAGAAVWYWYKPGHPMNIAGAGCTGSWALRGSDGMFFLTAGHCASGVNAVVSGTDTRFGFVRRNEDPSMDALLVQPDSGVDAYQIVEVNGITVGRTTGMVHNWSLTPGTVVSKGGRTTGITSGTIRVQSTWDGRERVYCGDYAACAGDSGGPVYQKAGSSVLAVGVHVGRQRQPSGVLYSCFISIDDLLARFGAWLPVFSG